MKNIDIRFTSNNSVKQEFIPKAFGEMMGAMPISNDACHKQ